MKQQSVLWVVSRSLIRYDLLDTRDNTRNNDPLIKLSLFCLLLCLAITLQTGSIIFLYACTFARYISSLSSYVLLRSDLPPILICTNITFASYSSYLHCSSSCSSLMLHYLVRSYLESWWSTHESLSLKQSSIQLTGSMISFAWNCIYLYRNASQIV